MIFPILQTLINIPIKIPKVVLTFKNPSFKKLPVMKAIHLKL